ncbi:FAB7 [Cyberlindnera jadinii]|uniref:FAB7 protein n=1 Tax=Cyberlindnera jadinii (strain ATCC 18201 / CBS 1600 / BCRC 20928 / JCM 3617 / NBRC 0987 / NRRL Y-1542) TaxID=983966 RepID=A0A0H5C710_CYBJN|nr:NAD(P)-binding protein [Cyberlindnera jadinii NRRL Y-1542]ODV72007.1 NAD(P)-binding protein [Cyberlindnera jadinii NRRL Y-1542]CEP23697.1 FAB7 [Cyberlindnera jadinii]
MPTYFITGANRGLGRELVKQLLESGDNHVIATLRHLDNIPEVMVTRNPKLTVLKLDYNDPQSLVTLATELQKMDCTIDVFIANAALNNAKSDVLNSTEEEYLNFFKVNTLGPIETLKIIKPYMLKSKSRKIIFKSSIMGSVSEFPYFLASAYPCAPYCLSKAAMNMLSKELSYELKPENFIVISYHPGLIDTKEKDRPNDDVSIKPDFVPDEAFIKYVTKENLSIEEAVRRELKIISELKPEDNGHFMSHDGSYLAF